MVPNFVDDMKLSPYAVRLYMHMRRRAGEGEAGECFETSKHLAEYCLMSVGQVSKCKKELVASGLITISRVKKGHGEFASDVTTIKDIWKVNELWFKVPKERRKDAVLEHKEYSRDAVNGFIEYVRELINNIAKEAKE